MGQSAILETAGRGRDRSIEVSVVRVPAAARPSRRSTEVAVRFGLSPEEMPRTIVPATRIDFGPGKLIALVGPSGSGKSSALEAMEKQFPDAISVHRILFPADSAIVDAVAPSGSLDEALSILTACGLGEARLWMRRFEELSEGERFRARLARAISLQPGTPDGSSIFCDEFCSTLHRRAARVVSFNLRKLAARRKLCLVVAATDESLLTDLQPSTVIRFHRPGEREVKQGPAWRSKAISFSRRLAIESGSKADYESFAAMHYRATDELGFVDRVFVLREGRGGEILGIVVYSYSPLELSLRNRATGGRFTRNGALLNREMRILRRLIIHPDVRGCGLGHALVRRTLPLVGVDFVECLAAMGEYNPVFERAGMIRVGQCEVPSKGRAALEELRALDVDANGADFVERVCRDRRVRGIVSKAVFDWYAATTGGGSRRVERQSPRFLAAVFRNLAASRPVYYLWRRSTTNARSRFTRDVEMLSAASAKRERPAHGAGVDPEFPETSKGPEDRRASRHSRRRTNPASDECRMSERIARPGKGEPHADSKRRQRKQGRGSPESNPENRHEGPVRSGKMECRRHDPRGRFH